MLADIYSHNSALNDKVDQLLTPKFTDLLRDPRNKEVSINAGGQVFVDDGNPYLRNTGIVIPEVVLRAVIRLLVADNGSYLNPNAPFANLDLAGGARFHGALAPVANEPQISIRLHYGMGRPLKDFATPEQIELIRQHIADRKTIIVSGATASGKSTMMNAVVNELIPHDARLVIIEDVWELRPDPTRDIVRRLANDAVTVKEHVKQSLRLRPDWLCVGETRDHSAWDLLDAARTGHPGLSTVHAASAHGTITRLMSLASCDRQFMYEAVDLILFVEKMPDGSRSITQTLTLKEDDLG